MNDKNPDALPEYDCVIIGCGMAGLSAAYALRSSKILALESSNQPGGRVQSCAAGDHALNFGAHMFGGPDTPIGHLLSELNVPAAPISGKLMGLVYGGKRLLWCPTESYPLLMPLTLRERMSMIHMGIRLRLGSNRFLAHMKSCSSNDANMRQMHALSFANTLSLSQTMGKLSPRIAAFLTAITERNGADPEDMAAGHALRSFVNVWSANAPGRNVVGGSGLLPQAMARALGDKIRYGAEVVDVIPCDKGVTVRYMRGETVVSLKSKTAIVAAPAPVASKIVRHLPVRTQSALEAITYGPFLTGAILTHETGAMPWDKHYAIATPGRSFSVLFNMSTALRAGTRRAGGSLMMFRGARGAAELMEKTDAQISQMFRQDLLEVFPEAEGVLGEIAIKRWPLGAPYAKVGRAKIQSDLTASLGRVFLAGDYFEFPNMEAAVNSGQDSAKKALALITNRLDP